MSTEPDTATPGADTVGNPGTPAPPPAPAAPDLSGLQAAIDEAARTGQTKALQPLLDAAGVPDAKGLQEFVTAARERAEKDKTDEQRRADELAARERAANERVDAANALARQAMIRSSLVLAGMDGEKVADRVGWVSVDNDADQAAVDAAVASFKERNPELFAAPAATPAPPHSVGARPTNGATNVTPFDAGKERARKAKQQATGATREDLIRQFSNQSSPLAPIA